MAARSIASLTITFGLVSIPVKPYSAYDKAYFLAPDKGGPKPYALLSQAMYPAPLQLTPFRSRFVARSIPFATVPESPTTLPPTDGPRA